MRSSALSALLAAPRVEARPSHFHVLDFSRGIAAVTILFWHYQHFFILTPGAEPPQGFHVLQPNYHVLHIFYNYGYAAVQYFWILSGFIFASVYLTQSTSTRTFFVNRVARLYPLHALTLLVVLGLQIVAASAVGQYEIYRHNSAHYFVLQLLFASNWISPTTPSFNGPIWSVSVEVLFYALFWYTRTFLYRFGVVGPLTIVGCCWVLGHVVSVDAGILLSCGQYFFMGVTINLVFRSNLLGDATLAAIGLILAVAGIEISHAFPVHFLGWGLPVLAAGCLLVVLGLEKSRFSAAARRLGWVGDSTYGIYLWHVPVQIACLIFLDAFVGNRLIVQSPAFLIGFIIVVLGVARISFVMFERPARRTIRRMGLPKFSTAIEPGAGISAP